MIRARPRCLLAPLAAAGCSAALLAQSDWHTPVAVPKARAVHTAAYDPVSSQIVMFGGNTNTGVQGDTWVWSAAAGWRNAQPLIAPSARREHAMAHDLVRGETVVFGGWDGVHVADTWLWNGTNWRQAAPANSPTPRMAEMAFDPVLGRVLLFGGEDANGTRLAETWSWDGSNWIQLAPATTPPARFDHALATDWARNQVVLFGGYDNGFLGDTWIWNGIDWAAGPAGPAPRSEHKMAFVGGNVLLFAGETTSGRVQDTWQWNGAVWTQLTPTLRPAVREEHVLVEDLGNGRAVLFGGWHSTTGHLADQWTFAAGQWTQSTAAQPIGAGTGAMDYDPLNQRSLLFGGYQDQQISNQTWAYANGSWTRLFPLAQPPPRAEPALVYDRPRNQFVLFGGANGSTYYNDTWNFTANSWQQRFPASSPPARWGHALVCDEARGTVLLFSGRQGGANNNLTDTWEWNGSQWTQLLPATSPAGREDHALVFDQGRGEPILFGGWVGGSGYSNETWAFTAGNWVQLLPANLPSARSEHSMVYDRVRQCVLMFGGEDASGRLADTWEFTGNWVQLAPGHAPEPREEAVIAFDEQLGETVLALGWDLGHFTDTWQFGSRPAATTVAYGTGCQGSAPAPPALASGRPWLGGSVTATATSLPVASPLTALAFGAGRIALPLDGFGMPGCTALLQPIATALMLQSGTTATLAFALPPVPAFVGTQFHLQTYTVAPGANPTGVLASHGLELTASLR